ncbi:helix-turn-helix domain-containing protein [Haloarcula salina]|uniref:helix-turn-helix domain-containing protein n=1 Tax=Haloarcula salina TaxID=1429914 RepID=UPI003C6F7E78
MAQAEPPMESATDRASDAEEATTRRPETVSVEELRSYLREVEGKTATQRITVGINHKEGVSQTELADWYDVSRTTIHNWLNRLERLEDEPPEAVIYDEKRPGRPPKLDDCQQRQLTEVLTESPREVGFDAEEWHPKLARVYIEETFDVEYTVSYVRELMHEASVSWTKHDSNGQDVERVQEAFKSGFNTTSESGPRTHGCRR